MSGFIISICSWHIAICNFDGQINVCLFLFWVFFYYICFLCAYFSMPNVFLVRSLQRTMRLFIWEDMYFKKWNYCEYINFSHWRQNWEIVFGLREHLNLDTYVIENKEEGSPVCSQLPTTKIITYKPLLLAILFGQ